MNQPPIGNVVRRVPPPHPACLEESLLLTRCTMTQTRRGGPGGQHRNKTSTTIVLTHETGIAGEGSERRSQADNRRSAIRRLRESLALELRTDANAAVVTYRMGTDDELELVDWPAMVDLLRKRHGGGKMRLSESNVDRPAVLAILLDDFFDYQGNLQPVAARWGTSGSQVTRFLREFPRAMDSVNAWRREAGSGELR
jgi:hypothetical protein